MPNRFFSPVQACLQETPVAARAMLPYAAICGVAILGVNCAAQHFFLYHNTGSRRPLFVEEPSFDWGQAKLAAVAGANCGAMTRGLEYAVTHKSFAPFVAGAAAIAGQKLIYNFGLF